MTDPGSRKPGCGRTRIMCNWHRRRPCGERRSAKRPLSSLFVHTATRSACSTAREVRTRGVATSSTASPKRNRTPSASDSQRAN